MANTATANAIMDFVVNELLYDKEAGDFTASDSLLQSGLFDSLAVVMTMEFCEATFGVRFDESDVVPENFENIEALAALVERSLASKSQSA
jgi:acyl carrier protein